MSTETMSPESPPTNGATGADEAEELDFGVELTDAEKKIKWPTYPTEWNPVIQNRLLAPFDEDEIKWKPSAGKMLAHVQSRAIMSRLDRVVGAPNWCFDYTVERLTDENVCIKGRLTILGVTKCEGGEEVSPLTSGGKQDKERFKNALSDALKRTAVLFGIGRFLYYLEGTSEKALDPRQVAVACKRIGYRGEVKFRSGTRQYGMEGEAASAPAPAPAAQRPAAPQSRPAAAAAPTAPAAAPKPTAPAAAAPAAPAAAGNGAAEIVTPAQIQVIAPLMSKSGVSKEVTQQLVTELGWTRFTMTNLPPAMHGMATEAYVAQLVAKEQAKKTAATA